MAKLFTKLLGIAVLLVGVTSAAFAQRTISGTVTDKEGTAIPGASVTVKNTTTGAVTDAAGKFQLTLPEENSTIVISFIGYKTTELLVQAGLSTLTVVLEEDVTNLDEILVTGVMDRRTVMEASVAISVVKVEQLARQVPVSATDVLQNVPGVYVNSAAGEIRNTIYSRGVSTGSGDAGRGYYYVSMQEDGLPVTNATYANYGPDYFQRVDATLGRVEAVRGGTASILGANAPGGLFNYIMKEGGAITSGEVRTRYGLLGDGRNNFYRADINVGGPMGKNWFWDAGGFYRYDQGNAYPGYAMNKGGQFRANVVKKYNTGSLKIYGKLLDDRNGWNQLIPTVDFEHPKTIDGFHGYTSVMSNALHKVFPVNQTGTGTYNGENLAHNKDASIGFNWEQQLGTGWTFTNAFRYSNKSSIWNVNGHQSYLEINNLLSYAYMGQLGRPGLYSFIGATSGEPIVSVQSNSGYDFSVVSGATPGANWSPNSLLFMPLLTYEQDAKETLEQFTLSKELKNMSFKIGGFFAHSDVDKGSGGGGASLGLMQERPENVIITRTNPNGTIANITDASGIYGTGGGRSFNHAIQNQMALFFGHNYQITEALNLDWGARFEHITVNGYNSPGITTQSTTGGLDGNPLTLYDNSIGSAPETFDFDKSISTFSYSAGLNYKLDENFAVYGRYTQGKKAPDLDMYFNANTAALVAGLDPIAQDIMQVEAGVKLKTTKANLFVTPFYSQLSNVAGIQWFSNPDLTTYFTAPVFNKYRTLGVEVEGDWAFAKNFNLRAVLTVQKGTAVDYSTWIANGPGAANDSLVTYSGKEQENLPRMILNLTPSYKIDKFYAQLTWAFLGKRQANAANAFILPSFSQFNFNASYDISKRVNIGVTINNLFNTYGIMSWARPGYFITSTDPQGFTKEIYEQQKDQVYLSTAIPPRAYFITATFKF